jgi:hypothetical protein
VSEPHVEDLWVYAGDVFVHEFTWLYEGEPQPLTGLIGSAQVRATRESGTTLATMTVDIIDADAGIFTITMSAAQTRALPVGRFSCFYDVQFTDAGAPTTPVMGRFSVRQDVTRS